MRAGVLPGALALGLVAALLAHTAAYGGSHAMGGVYHGALLGLSEIAVVFSTVAALAMAWSGARRVANGSVLAARLRDFLPGWTPIAASALGWFVLAEHLEPHHAEAPLLVLGALLAFASWLVLAVARGLLAVLARAAVTARRCHAVQLAHLWVRRVSESPLPHIILRSKYRYARPPPIAV
jgi:hypothetical protein